MHLHTPARVAATALVLSASLLTFSAPAYAASGGSAQTSGVCDGGSTFELKASTGGGQLKVGFKVGTPFTNRTWVTTITDNGTVIASDSRFLTGNGFSIDASSLDQPGPDSITVDSAAGPLTCHRVLVI